MIKNKVVEKSNPIVAYKGFNNDFSCRDFHYEVGKEYHNDGDAELCHNGFHACLDPLNVFTYYEMSSHTRYAMVELWGDVETDIKLNKICATDIRIVKEMSIDELVEIGIKMSSPKNDLQAEDEIIDICDKESNTILSNENYQQIASSGNMAKIDATGKSMIISSSGRKSNIVSIGDLHCISTSGYRSRVVSQGNYASVASSDTAEIFSNGNNAELYTGGDASDIASNGDNAKICMNSINGYVNSSGDNATIMSTKNSSTIESTGKKAIIMSAGQYTKARAKVGSWIVLTEYVNGKVKHIKAEYVDGKRIKGDTLYTLFCGEFVETK